MLCREKSIWHRVARFAGDEYGSATIEFVLWVPIFVTILVAATDATVLYLNHTEMWNVSRDVVRRISVGDITEADAATYVQNELFLRSASYTVQTSDPADLDVWVSIETNIGDASVFGIFKYVASRNLVATVTMRREPT